MESKRVRRRLIGYIGVSALIMTWCMTGCTPVHPQTSVGTGTYSYATDTLSWIYPVPIEELWQATLAEIDASQLHVLDRTIDGLGGMVETIRPDAIKVHFALEPESLRTTRLNVRIGGLERHRNEAERLHAQIRQRLKLAL